MTIKIYRCANIEGSLNRLWKFVLYLHLRSMLCGVYQRMTKQYVKDNPHDKKRKKKTFFT